MFWTTLFFYREPGRSGEVKVASVWTALSNMIVVLANLRFVLFLAISSGFYIVFWQQYISVPLFIRGYVNPKADVDLMLSVDPIVVICFQILAAYLTRKMPAVRAMALGFLITGLSWILLAIHPTVPMLVATLVGVAIGEITQASRYYEYVSRLAPPGTARAVHGVRISSDRDRIFYRGAVRRLPDSSFRGSAARAAEDVVGDRGYWSGDCGAHVALRQRFSNQEELPLMPA